MIAYWAYFVLLGPLAAFSIFCVAYGMDRLAVLPAPALEFLLNFGLFGIVLVFIFIGASMAPLFSDSYVRGVYLHRLRIELLSIWHWRRRD